jgi:hypothetical protein
LLRRIGTPAGGGWAKWNAAAPGLPNGTASAEDFAGSPVWAWGIGFVGRGETTGDVIDTGTCKTSQQQSAEIRANATRGELAESCAPGQQHFRRTLESSGQKNADEPDAIAGEAAKTTARAKAPRHRCRV